MSFFKRLFGIKEDDQSGIPKPYIDESGKRSTSIDEVMENKSGPLVEQTRGEKNETEALKEDKRDNIILPESNRSELDTADWISFKENGKKGYKNYDGKIMIEARFDEAYLFKENVAPVKIGEKWGMINTHGEYLLNPENESVYWAKEGMVLFEKDGLCGFALTSGKIIIPLQYFMAGDFCEGLSAVTVKDKAGHLKAGYINKENKIVIDFKFDETNDFNDGLAAVIPLNSADNKLGYINKHGDFVIEPQFDDALEFIEGLAPVEIEGKWAYINKQGKLICDPVYYNAGNFFCGLSCVQKEKDGLWGYADKTGKLVIPFQFDYESDFDMDGTAYVFLKGKCLTLYPDGSLKE